MKNIHIKVYCSNCGRLLLHIEKSPIEDKNFFKLEVDPCPDCMGGAAAAGFDEAVRQGRILDDRQPMAGEVG